MSLRLCATLNELCDGWKPFSATWRFAFVHTNWLVSNRRGVNYDMNETHVKVRFCETDALGHINNTSYFIYLEEARVRLIEALGYGMDAQTWKFILASTKCDFINQAYFNQHLLVQTFVTKIGTKSFHLEHDMICTDTGKLIAKGYEVMVYFDFEQQESKAIPEQVQEGLKGFLLQK